MTQAIILAGGLGTRLRDLYPDRPKALVPILGRPFLQWQLEWLARGGVTDVLIAAGYKADMIAGWVEGQFQVPGSKFQVGVSAEPRPLGTAGGLKYVEGLIRGDRFYVLNGDSLVPNLIFQTLEKSAGVFPSIGKSAPGAVIAVARIEESGRYGTVEFDAGGRVTAFREKAERKAGWINGGVYLMSRATLGLVEPGKNLSIETDLFPEMARRGLLRVFPADAPLLDMGTPEGIRAMEAYLAAPS